MRNYEIDKLRKEGMGYKKIAIILNISVNTVKSYCKRNPIPEDKSKQCLNCGNVIYNTPHKKEKKFCSDKCRLTWWNAHQDRVTRKANYNHRCLFCGTAFTSYGNNHRKFCSRDCYANARRREVIVNG